MFRGRQLRCHATDFWFINTCAVRFVSYLNNHQEAKTALFFILLGCAGAAQALPLSEGLRRGVRSRDTVVCCGSELAHVPKVPRDAGMFPFLLTLPSLQPKSFAEFTNKVAGNSSIAWLVAGVIKVHSSTPIYGPAVPLCLISCCSTLIGCICLARRLPLLLAMSASATPALGHDGPLVWSGVMTQVQ